MSTRKPYPIGFLFTHKNGDFGAISVKRSEAAPRQSRKWRATYRIDFAPNFGAM